MSKFFFRLGGSLWILLVSIALLVWLVGSLREWTLTLETWKNLGVYLGGGGLASIALGFICGLWED